MTEQPKPQDRLLARISVQVPPDLKAKALDKSRRTGITISHVVRRALEAWTEQPD